VAEARGFDQDYRLTGIADIGGSSTLQSLTYGYYPTNNVQTITNAVASSQNVGSANMNYGYGTGSDQLATLTVAGTVVQTIGYTADGKIASLNPGIQAPGGQYITSLSSNQGGRLASVNAGAGTLASYTYDGFEQRVIKTVSGSYGEIDQYGQDGALLEETNASGVAEADYIYLNGRPVAVLNGSTLYYIHDDMLGTPQLATDGNPPFNGRQATMLSDRHRSAEPSHRICACRGSISILRAAGTTTDSATTRHNWAATSSPIRWVGWAAGTLSMYT
jgi:YD repeat-containing protein